MDDLISRAEALKAMHKMWRHIVAVARRNHPTEGEKAVYLDMQNTIKALPSEQRTGKWKKIIPSNWGASFACSECGEKTVETVMGKPRYEYCPMCGARMDGTQKKPCDDCQQFDCYGCEYAERKEE